MSCEEKVKAQTSHCKCLTKQIEKFSHPSAVPKLIDDIMKNYFCKKAGQGSSCSLFSVPKGSVYSMDRRLLYWSNILEDRKKLACRIRQVTGKRLSHVLYNQIDDHRNVQTVKRIINFAERLDPTKLATRRLNHIRSSSIFETLPQSERLQKANLEIVGTPKVIQAEQWIQQGNNAFFASKFLQQKLKNKKSFSKVIEFYPETDRLEVVGKRIHKHAKPMIERDSDAEYDLSVMSSDSHLEPLDFPEYSIQIDDMVLKSDSKPIDFNLDFKCQPYETQVLKLCRIKNIGRKPVRFVWKKIKPRGFAYLPLTTPAFHFNQNAFRLTYSESKVVEVFFKPTSQMLCEEEWQLKTEPSFFEETLQIHVRLSGECYIPKDMFQFIVGDLITQVIPGRVCKKPLLTECELFEKLNPGFKCIREDLQKFKEIYRQFKKKSHPKVWDLKIYTLKLLIEGTRDFIKRNQGLNNLKRIIRDMKRQFAPQCDSNIKVQLAKSVILSFLDKWESKAIQIVDSVARTDIDVLIIRMPFLLEKLEHCQTVEDKRKLIQNQALCIQMYCCICDLAEEIVFFIENCLLLEQNI